MVNVSTLEYSILADNVWIGIFPIIIQLESDRAFPFNLPEMLNLIPTILFKFLNFFVLYLIKDEKKNLINCKYKECLFFCKIEKISDKIFRKKLQFILFLNNNTLNFIKSRKKFKRLGNNNLAYLW